MDNVRGIMWMVAAVLVLTLMFTIVKQMVKELPVFVVALARTTVALVWMIPWISRVGLEGIKTKRLGGHATRAFLGVSAFVCVVYALSKLLLADVMVLAFTSPLWTIVLSAVILGEIAGPRRIVATLVGFSGVLLIVKPQGGFEPASLIALGSALLTSIAMTTIKSLSATEPPKRIVFYFFAFGTLMMLVPAIATWQTPTMVQLMWLMAAGILGAVGQDWLTRAYDAAQVTIIAPLDFLRLPAAAILGFVLFDELPDGLSLLGMTIIILASVYIARQETPSKQAASRLRTRSDSGT